MSSFGRAIHPFVSEELALAQSARRNSAPLEFRHLENAHVLGQASTREHVRVHWAMLLWGLRNRRPSEVAGQLLRIVGAATKTSAGLVPSGNTGGANVSAFQPMRVDPELEGKIEAARLGS